MKNTYSIREISWEEIKSIWEEHLWPDKRGGIKPVQEWYWREGRSKVWMDRTITQRNKDGELVPTFFGVMYDGPTITLDFEKLVGVNSGFETGSSEQNYYRSRGLWVNPKHRRQGLASMLLNATIEDAKKKECDWIWTCPREGAMSAYKSVGFIQISDWFTNAQYGPNCIAAKYL